MQYNYFASNEIDNSYYFETSNGYLYQIKFKPSPYVFEFDEEVKDYIFEFVIGLIENKTGKRAPLDPIVSNTVAVIFREFLLKHNNNIALYICDSSDGRQDLRRRKFDEWFNKYQNDGFIKVDEHILDSSNNFYPVSLIVQKKHPKFLEIIDAFVKISENNNLDK
jgi:hypothetical protein